MDLLGFMAISVEVSAGEVKLGSYLQPTSFTSTISMAMMRCPLSKISTHNSVWAPEK